MGGDTESTYIPYNNNNKEITLKDVQGILTTYNIPSTVNNLNLYKRAFIHSSYLSTNYDETSDLTKPINCVPLKSKSNERLEFLGDGILELVTKYLLYKRFPKENEGFMTEKKIALVKNEAIGKLTLQMKLHKWFIISKSAEDKGIRTNIKKLGCLFEAFIGAIFLDFNKISIKDEDNYFSNLFLTGPGFQICQVFIENVFEQFVNWEELLQIDDNYKNILQVLLQKKFKITPDYIETQPKTDINYYMGVFLCFNSNVHVLSIENALPINNFQSLDSIESFLLDNTAPVLIKLGEASHKIKKKAEQLACKQVLEYFNYSN